MFFDLKIFIFICGFLRIYAEKAIENNTNIFLIVTQIEVLRVSLWIRSALYERSVLIVTQIEVLRV